MCLLIGLWIVLLYKLITEGSYPNKDVLVGARFKESTFLFSMGKPWLKTGGDTLKAAPKSILSFTN